MGYGTLTTRRNHVFYDELADFHTTFRSDVHEARRLCLVPFAQRANFNYAMLPQVSIGAQILPVLVVSKHLAPVTSVFRRELIRLDGEPHPLYPHLIATSCEEVKGLGWPAQAEGGLLHFKQGLADAPFVPDGYCVIAVNYKAPPYRTASAQYTNAVINDGFASPLVYEWIRYTSVRTKASAKNIIMQGANFIYVIGQTNPPRYNAVPERGTMTVSSAHLTYTWHMCPRVPHTANSLMGCVNNISFDYLDRGHPVSLSTAAVGTVLYLNWEASDVYYTTAGTPVVDLTYHLLYLPTGHNKLYRHTYGDFHPVSRVRDVLTPSPPIPASVDPTFRQPPGYNIYDYANLNTLFAILDPVT